jgi:hypothetical protein
MASAAELVNQSFALAQGYAASAQSQLSSFASALEGSIGAAPTYSVTFSAPAQLPVASIDGVPTWSIDAVDLGTTPTSDMPAMGSIIIDDFNESAPTVNFPVAPTLNYGSAPAIPAVGAVALPDAPVLAAVALPTFLSLSTPTFGGVDLHTDYLTKLENIPTLNLVAPTPYYYARGPEYASQLLDTLKAVLTQRMAGGTGLNPAVEQAIWDRARSRETQTALANEAEVMRNSEAMGFQLPSGVLAAQLREAQQNYYDKLSGLSRDISIKQAELEQENLKQTIASGMQLEGQLIDYSLKLEQMTFEAAKTAAENGIQIYNAQVEQFKALLSAYNTYAAAYKTIMDAELSKVEVYKAELQAEQTKAAVNESLVQQYKAQIEAGLSQVEIYKAQVGAANTMIQLEQAKIGAAGEQIKAYVAQVNAETAKIEAYKAGVQAESSKIEVYRVKSQAFSAKAGAQAEKARAEISRFSAIAQSKAAEWDGYKALISAKAARAQSQASAASASAEAFRAKAAAIEAGNNSNARAWEGAVKQYEASINVGMQAAKMNGDWALQASSARLDAAKAGTQVYAQLTSSAYGMMHTSAGISGSASMSVGYSYGGDVAGAVGALTSI